MQARDTSKKSEEVSFSVTRLRDEWKRKNRTIRDLADELADVRD